MKKILAGALTIVVLLSMVLTVSASDVATKSFSFQKDYNGDGVSDYSFSMTKVLTNAEGKAKREVEKFPKVTKDKDTFTSNWLTHPGGNVNFFVVKEGSTIDLTGSAYTYGYAHSDIYKLVKKEDGSFKYGSFTRIPTKKTGDATADMFAPVNFVEFTLTEEGMVEKPMGEMTWGVRGKGSKLVLNKEGYYVISILAPTQAALRNPIPPYTELATPAVTDKAIIASNVFIHVVK